MDVHKVNLNKKFETLLLQTASEILGRLRMLVTAREVNSETVCQYDECLAQVKLIGRFAAEVVIKGNSAQNQRKATAAILQEIVTLVEPENNPFALAQDLTRATDLPSMLRAMTVRGVMRM